MSEGSNPTTTVAGRKKTVEKFTIRLAQNPNPGATMLSIMAFSMMVLFAMLSVNYIKLNDNDNFIR
jgi:hypothetical protein